MTFEADYPGAQVFPAHPDNYGYSGAPPEWRAIVLHTPEEDADDYEGTPHWFADPRARASTHFYADNDGDIIQMVPLSEGAYAHGVYNYERRWKGQMGVRPPWAPTGSYNMRAIGIEIEGRGFTIHKTLKIGSPQWIALIAWIRWTAERYSIPLDRDHIVGHTELTTRKTDPGALFPWDALMAALTPTELPPELTRIEGFMAVWRNGSTPVRVEGGRDVYEFWRRRV